MSDQLQRNLRSLAEAYLLDVKGAPATDSRELCNAAAARIDELEEALKGVAQNDKSRYEHHEPRPDGAKPRIDGGTRWCTPREIAVAALVPNRPKAADEVPPFDVMCACRTWATDRMSDLMLGNGHNPACQHYRFGAGAIDLLTKLREGIKWWADQEDGVPDELWEPYSRATFIVTGRLPQERATV